MLLLIRRSLGAVRQQCRPALPLLCCMLDQHEARPRKQPRRDVSSSRAAAQQRDDSACAMPHQAQLDAEDWTAIQQHLAAYDAARETVIKRSRDAQKAAKQAIYSLHRGDFDKAAQQLQAVEHVGTELLPIVQQEPTLRQGSFSSAMEEYAEARVFMTYLQEGRIIKSTELGKLANTEEFLGGVLDFTGELNRHAVACATQRDVAAVQRARGVVDSIQGQFLQMDLRNGALRKKCDSLKYVLNKMEGMLYDLSLAAAPKAGQANMPASEPQNDQPMGNDEDDAAA